MNRKISLLFFVATVVLVGLYFFRMIQPLLLPIVMAGTLALLLQPVYLWTVDLLKGRRRIAAAIVCIGVILLLVLPVFTVLGFATLELLEYGDEVVETVQQGTEDAARALNDQPTSELEKQSEHETASGLSSDYTVAQAEAEQITAPEPIPAPEPTPAPDQPKASDASVASDDIQSFVSRFRSWLSTYFSDEQVEDLQASSISMARSLLSEIYDKTAGLISNVIAFLVGFAVMILAIYYFLAEGPEIAREIKHLLPFEERDEDVVLKQFETVCRGVVIGTFAAALAQAALLGVAMGLLQVPAAWLLTCLTAVFALVPLLGAGGVYFPVAAYLALDGRYAAAIFLVIYGMAIVSTVDNLIRAHMIHGTSRLHPLVALVSALGALKLVGLWGIFVGPVIAGIFHALLKIMQHKLRADDPLPAAESQSIATES